MDLLVIATGSAVFQPYESATLQPHTHACRLACPVAILMASQKGYMSQL